MPLHKNDLRLHASDTSLFAVHTSHSLFTVTITRHNSTTHLATLATSNFTTRVTDLQNNVRYNIHVQGGSKSKLLILSEYVNKTEKIGGM